MGNADLFPVKIPPINGTYITGQDLREAGYPEAVLRAPGWAEVHRECREIFGKRYTWTGSNFFFLNETDRALFVLKWG